MKRSWPPVRLASPTAVAPARTAGGVPAPDAAARDELAPDARGLRRVRELDRDELQLLQPHLEVREAHDAEERRRVRRRVGQDGRVRLAGGGERAARRDERPE